MSKRAVILAGGKGSRLRPYTVVLPKPLMPIGDYPILEVIIKQLKYYGFDHITLAVNHQADLLKSYFSSGEKWSVKIDYSLETTPLGTMAPLKMIHDLPDNFLVMNGDVLTDLNFNSFYEKHSNSNALFTISSKERVNLIDFGVLEMNDENTLTGFIEKPNNAYRVSMGVYALNKKVMDFIPGDQYFGFDSLMYKLLEAKETVKIHSHPGYWLDIGRPDDYMEAIEKFETDKSLFLND
jgi:NDP-sugar pyrophosphorylase family protein